MLNTSLSVCIFVVRSALPPGNVPPGDYLTPLSQGQGGGSPSLQNDAMSICGGDASSSRRQDHLGVPKLGVAVSQADSQAESQRHTVADTVSLSTVAVCYAAATCYSLDGGGQADSGSGT